MKITRKKISIAVIVMFIAVCFTVYAPNYISANEFEGNESYWTSYCSGYISDANKRDKCNEYSVYIQNKINDSKNSANSLSNTIADVKADLSNLKEVSQAYQSQIDAYEAEIAAIQSALVTAREGIAQVEVVIREKEEKIEKRKVVIRERMIDTQVRVNTNQFIEYIMGATDLVDLIQRSSSVESFTRNDKEQITLLNQEKEELEVEKAEKKRIEDDLKLQEENLKITQQNLENIKAANDEMVEKTEVKVAELLKAQNEANAAANTLAQLKPNFTISNGNADITVTEPSAGWTTPIQGTYISRGVDNNGHRGVDYAAGAGTPIVAPANAYVVFASNAYPNVGYLGNMIGVPAGGGNSVRIIFSVNGETFAMNFHHMQNNVPAMAYNGTGVAVPAGTVLGYVGSSGNSSGPHAHVELFKLNQSVSEAIATWYRTGDWQSSCGWGLYTPAYGSYGTRVDPRSYLG